MVSLNFTVLERNDNCLITFTDTSTTWGSPSYTSIQPLTSLGYGLTMSIAITTTSGTVTYDTIDLTTVTSLPWSTQSALLFPVSAANLKVSGVPYGLNTVELPDGIWAIAYSLVSYVGGVWTTLSTVSQSVLVIGQSQSAVYNRLMMIPNLYEIKNNYREIQEVLFYYTYLEAIQKSAFLAQQNQLINMLSTLQRLLLNGSNYPW